MAPEREKSLLLDKKEQPQPTGVIFPGQGSQFVGMGQPEYGQFARVRRVYRATNKVFSNRDPEDPTISDVSFYGPSEKLMDTYYTQGAIFAHNHACDQLLRKLKHKGFTNARFIAGHSLGEYNALVTSGVITFKDGLRLVRKRGELMQMINEVNPGGQLALPLSASDERLKETLDRFNLEISLINAPNQTVVGGTNKSLEEFAKSAWAKENNIRGVRLRTRGSFHTSFMGPAVNPFYQELKTVKIRHPNIPVIGNTSAKPLNEAEEVIEELIQHFTKTVLWVDSLKYMFNHGVAQTMEVGTDQAILSKLNQLINGGGFTESIKGLFTRYSNSQPQAA